MRFCAVQHFLMVNTEKEKIMLVIKLLERLAEMFPKQDYQSRLEQYLASRYPTCAADVELFTREYEYKQYGHTL